VHVLNRCTPTKNLTQSLRARELAQPGAFYIWLLYDWGYICLPQARLRAFDRVEVIRGSKIAIEKKGSCGELLGKRFPVAPAPMPQAPRCQNLNTTALPMPFSWMQKRKPIVRILFFPSTKKKTSLYLHVLR
jgi:hypothetical protein